GATFNDIEVVGKYAYTVQSTAGTSCTTFSSLNCQLRIFDIYNPANPTWAGGINTGIASTYTSIDVVGKYAYVTQNNSNSTCSSGQYIGCEFLIFDISNPADRRIQGVVWADSPTSGSGSIQYNDVKVVGKYAYIVKNGNTGTC